MSETKLEDYLDIKSFLEKYPQFSESQIRWLIFKKEKLGVTHVFRRLGKRIYIHVPSYLDFLKNQPS